MSKPKKPLTTPEGSRIIYLEQQVIEDSVTNAVQRAFAMGEESKRFIDTSRIPLICQDIRGIHENMNKMEGNITWIIRLVIGAVVTGLLALAFKVA